VRNTATLQSAQAQHVASRQHMVLLPVCTAADLPNKHPAWPGSAEPPSAHGTAADVFQQGSGLFWSRSVHFMCWQTDC
jgi:hypothetical protein